MPARTGAEYQNRLRERRELWFEDERVRDVTLCERFFSGDPAGPLPATQLL